MVCGKYHGHAHAVVVHVLPTVIHYFNAVGRYSGVMEGVIEA